MEEIKKFWVEPEEGEISKVKIVTTDLDIVEVSSHDYKGGYSIGDDPIKYVLLTVIPGPEMEDDIIAHTCLKSKKEALLLRNALDMMIKETWE